jgi:hypothetical protein
VDDGTDYPSRRTYPLTDAREYRLRRGVTLMAASFYSGISLARASYIERKPEKARPGEIERLHAAVDRAAADGRGGDRR